MSSVRHVPDIYDEIHKSDSFESIQNPLADPEEDQLARMRSRECL
ncbi:MAG TPA: hypothetical protein VJ695_01635 [Nitrososphaera sp.]|nr:hypothetical protein [Nitrososphaera sp.]